MGFGIVEYILETQGVCGIRIFVEVKGVDEGKVAVDGIAHQAKIALGGDAPPGRSGTATGRNSCRMGSMREDMAVARMGVLQECLAPRIVGSYVEGRPYGIGCELVPEGTDSVVAAFGIVEVGMGQVEPHIHNPHQHPTAGIGLWQLVAQIDWRGVNLPCHLVHVEGVAAVGLNTHDVTVEREGCQAVQGDVGNMDVAEARERTAKVLVKNGIVVNLHKSTEGRPHPTAANTTGCGSSGRWHAGRSLVLPQRAARQEKTAHPRRHLAQVGIHLGCRRCHPQQHHDY